MIIFSIVKDTKLSALDRMKYKSITASPRKTGGKGVSDRTSAESPKVAREREGEYVSCGEIYL